MTPEVQLREVSLRVTRPRVAVLTGVSAHPHADVDTLPAKIRSSLGSVSTQTVYDVLRALAEADLTRRIDPAGSPARFESRVGDNQHHVVCRTGGDVAVIDCATSSAPCLEASNTNGTPSISERNSLTLGATGPILLHDVQHIEQMAHFNRERVPEQSPHAKGSGRSEFWRWPGTSASSPRRRCSEGCQDRHAGALVHRRRRAGKPRHLARPAWLSR